MENNHKQKTIGILGGSFNPAHEGHKYISEQAIEILNLDEVWWLVSPQNPNKSQHNMGEFNERCSGAQILTKSCPQIKVTKFEKENGTNRTYQTLLDLKKTYHKERFIWLMGADNLASFHTWQNWQNIFKLIPIAVFDRGNYASQIKTCPAYKEFHGQHTSSENLIDSEPPSWCFLNIKKHPASSTKIRNNNT